jgi:leucine dehydrogenase
MTVFSSPAYEDHEAAHFFHDAGSGMRAIIAIHSTARGPAAGGCRMWNYASEQAAIDDALRLSRAMSYKNAIADLDLGGGKCVIVGDSHTDKTPALFEAVGDAVEQLSGRYWAAEDVGVTTDDLATVRRRTAFVAGLEGHPAASGDPSGVAAEGVFRGIGLCVRRSLNRDLRGVRVAIQGAGHVGAALAAKLAAAGAELFIADPDEALAWEVKTRTGAEIVAPGAIFDAPVDVFAPCAVGGTITTENLARLRARIIAGGANNPLANAEAGRAIWEKGLIYAPDFVINGGGIINVAGEIRALAAGTAFDPAWVEGKLARLMQTLEEVLERSLRERRPTQDVAGEMARERLRAKG